MNSRYVTVGFLRFLILCTAVSTLGRGAEPKAPHAMAPPQAERPKVAEIPPVVEFLSGHREREKPPATSEEMAERLFANLKTPTDMFCQSDGELKLAGRHQDEGQALAEILKRGEIKSFEAMYGAKAKHDYEEISTEAFAKKIAGSMEAYQLALYDVAYKYPFTEGAFFAAKELADTFLERGEYRLASAYYAKAYENWSVTHPGDFATRFSLLMRSMALARSLGLKERFKKLAETAAEFAAQAPPVKVADGEFTAAAIVKGGEKWFEENLPYQRMTPKPLLTMMLPIKNDSAPAGKIGTLFPDKFSEAKWYWRTVQLCGSDLFSAAIQNRNWLPIACATQAVLKNPRQSVPLTEVISELGKIENADLTTADPLGEALAKVDKDGVKTAAEIIRQLPLVDKELPLQDRVLRMRSIAIHFGYYKPDWLKNTFIPKVKERLTRKDLPKDEAEILRELYGNLK